jgi:DNA-binding NarL/FixJ family response regulator
MVARGIELGLTAAGDIVAVGSAGTVREALQASADLQPDVVVLDNLLPDGEGIDAVAAIRQGAPEASVVLVSGAADEGVTAAAIRAGCIGVIAKSADIGELADAVRRAARGEMTISQSLMPGVVGLLAQEEGGSGAALSPREQEVLGLLVDGVPTAQIAERLGLSRNTVRNHVRGILVKLEAHTQLEAVAIARRRGIVRR